MAKRAVIYIRTAAADNDGTARARRSARCEHYARAANMDIIGTYADICVSAMAPDRPGFSALVRDRRRKLIDYVLVADPSRIARTMEVEDRLCAQLPNAGVRVESADEREGA
jgi:DNA invertase Pin-like site-specific DNA recombinase